MNIGNFWNRQLRITSILPYGLIDCGHRTFNIRNALTAFHAYVAGDNVVIGIEFPHPTQQECRLAGLSRCMKHPVELIADIAMQLRPNQTIFRRQHVVVVGIAGSRLIEKSDFAFAHSSIFLQM